MANIITKLPSQHEKILKASFDDLITFGKVFLGGDFNKSATPGFHYEIGDELISQSNKPCAIILPRGHGKTSVSLRETVTCVDGKKLVADIVVGDYVYGSDGRPKEIVALSDVEYVDLYRITMADGRKLDISWDHLFTVRDQCPQKGNKQHYKTIIAEEIYKTYKKKAGDRERNRWAIDNHGPLYRKALDYSFDPYALGLVLGDGSIGKTGFAIVHGDYDDLVFYKSIIPYNCSLTRCSEENKNRIGRLGIKGSGPLLSALSMVGFVARKKFIPEKYFYGSESQRLDLLCGLMDTDGTTANGITSFTSVSRRLAIGVARLVRELGGNAKISRRVNGFGPYYHVEVRTSFPPFKLPRKINKWKSPKRNFYGAIVDVKPIGKGFARCLEVDSDDHLFVAGDGILTHNTLVKAKIIRDLCFAKKAAEWGFEEKPKSLFFGWVSSNRKKSQNNVAYVKLHLQYNDKINFYFGHPSKGNLSGERWNQEDIVTAYGDRLISSSNLTSMRGDTLATIEHGAVRYTAVFVDDAENEENTRTEGSREKIVDNIMNGILPAIEKNQPGCRLFLIETPVHFAAFAQKILDKWEHVKKEGPFAIQDFSWRVITYKATQPDLPGGVLWDSYMPRKRLDEIKKTYSESPRGVSGYYQEYELEVQSRENALWHRGHVKHWNGYYMHQDGQNYLVINGEHVPVNTFLGCDPATDIDTKNSDFSVIMAIAVDKANNVYVLDYERHRSIPTMGLRDKDGKIDGKKGVVDYLVEMYDKYHCASGTVEDVAMNRTIFQDLNRWRREHNRWNLAISPDKPGGRDKVNRIYSGLNQRFAAGGIYVKEKQYDLIDEIVKFGPKMAHDDTIEALYYACKFSYPPNYKRDHNYEIVSKRRKPKSWVVA